MDYKKIVMIVLLVVIVILGSARLVVFDKKLHNELFVESDTVIGNYEELNNDVIDYLKGYKAKIDTDMFTEKEKEHLKDVKWLIDVLSVVWYLCIIALIVMMYYFRDYEVLFYSGISVLIVMGAIAIFSSLNFSFAFEVFHKIFFPQGNYVFRTNLPKLYNSEWYALISLRIFTYSVIASILLIAQKFLYKLNGSLKR